MSDSLVKTEPGEDDEENGRTTPKRQSIQDLENAVDQSGIVTNQRATARMHLFDAIKEEPNGDADATVKLPTTEAGNDQECAGIVTTDGRNDNVDTASASELHPSTDSEVMRQTNTTAALDDVLIKDELAELDFDELENALGSLDQICNKPTAETNVSPPQAPSVTQLLPSPNAADEPAIQATVTSVHHDSTVSTTDVAVKKEPQYVNMSTEAATSNSIVETRPQISLVPTHRLRVKVEDSHDTTALPQDFFEDILPNEAPPPPRIRDDPIPENFFDDILVDKVKERIEIAETVELEEKYSDRLKELEMLENMARSRDKKKHKKSKKKSRRRSRDRDSRSNTPDYKRRREDDLPSTSSGVRSHRTATFEDGSLAGRYARENIQPMVAEDESQRRLTSTADIELVDDTADIEVLQPHLPEIGPHLTAKQKRDRILIRAKSLLSHLKRVEAAENKPMSAFLFTSTVRKLPASHSYRSQQYYENRSPLHTIKNVSYKFNSHSSNFNFEDWGLASLPPISAKIGKLVGYDAVAVHNKLKVIKIPAKIRTMKSDGQEMEDEEEPQLRSSLFCNATTQTDESVEIVPRKPQGYDIGVQAQPAAFEIACQTLETESPSINKFDNSDDLPIMAIMRELNENQLMALHDFAELLKEPASNAMDMYRLRQRMLDIYKCSQLPSALATPPSSSLNNYTSNGSSPTHAARPQQQGAPFRIQSVCSADGQRFSANDPRVNRNISNDVIRNIQPQPTQRYDPRYSGTQRFLGANNIESQRQQQSIQMQQQQRNQPTASGSKYYGRGGLRR